MDGFDFQLELDEALKNPEALAKILTKPETLRITTFSKRTWQRLEERGLTPPATQLSENRIGYRLVDIIRWLDARRRSASGSSRGSEEAA